MLATVNGIPIVELRLSLPRTGAWTGELTAEADRPLDFRLGIRLGELPFRAMARWSALTAGTAVADFVGGMGGLSKRISAKAYNSVPLRIPLEDIAVAAGEALSPHCSPEVMDLQLNAWCTPEGKCGQALNALLSIAPAAHGLKDVVWRIQPDGRLWVGIEAWAAARAEHELLTEDPTADRVVTYMERPTVLPGELWGGRRVSHVEHTIKDARLRTAVWFE